MQLGDQTARAHQAGQNDMFGLSAVPQPDAPRSAATTIKAIADFSEAVRLQGERETLGLYLTGHPIDRFEADLPRFAAHAHRRADQREAGQLRGWRARLQPRAAGDRGGAGG